MVDNDFNNSAIKYNSGNVVNRTVKKYIFGLMRQLILSRLKAGADRNFRKARERDIKVFYDGKKCVSRSRFG